MPDIKPGQMWMVRPDRESQWRRTQVVNVLSDEVELQYIDMPGASNVARTVRESAARMLVTPQRFLLVSGGA
jgi:hypothetical protein